MGAVPRHLWDNYETYTIVEREPTKHIYFALAARRGVRYIAIRVFYKDNKGEWIPSREGISLPILLPRFGKTPEHVAEDMIEILKEMIIKSEDFPLFDADNQVILNKRDDK